MSKQEFRIFQDLLYGNSSNPVAEVDLGSPSTIVYHVYYTVSMNMSAVNFRDGIIVEGFTYDGDIGYTQDPALKRITLTFENVSGVPNESIRIKLPSGWTRYFDVNSATYKDIGVLESNWTTLTLSKKSYTSPGIYEFIVPVDGKYKLTVYGANGGGNSDYSNNRGSRGGKGGMTSGTISLSKGQKLYAVVGGVGKSTKDGVANSGGYNGGGNGSRVEGIVATVKNSYGHGGGGATDIRLSDTPVTSPDSLKTKSIIVAGGGGGADDVDYLLFKNSGGLGSADDGSGGHGGGGSNSGGYGYVNGTTSGGAISGFLYHGYGLLKRTKCLWLNRSRWRRRRSLRRLCW